MFPLYFLVHRFVHLYLLCLLILGFNLLFFKILYNWVQIFPFILHLSHKFLAIECSIYIFLFLLCSILLLFDFMFFLFHLYVQVSIWHDFPSAWTMFFFFNISSSIIIWWLIFSAFLKSEISLLQSHFWRMLSVGVVHLVLQS